MTTTRDKRRVATKAVAAVTTAGMAAAFLTACGSNSGNDAQENAPPRTTTTAPAQPTQPNQPNQPTQPAPAEEIDAAQPEQSYMDQVFLQVIRGDLPSLAGMPDQQLLAIGHTAAEDYHNGATLMDLAFSLIDEHGFTVEEAGEILGAAIAAFGTTADGNRLQTELNELESQSY